MPAVYDCLWSSLSIDWECVLGQGRGGQPQLPDFQSTQVHGSTVFLRVEGGVNG